MTNKTAIAFGLFLLALIAFDLVNNSGANIVFLAQKGLQLIEWIAFWR